MNFFEKNLTYFEEKNEALASAIKKERESETRDMESKNNIRVSKGRYGYPVLSYEGEKGNVLLSSPYDGEGTFENVWYRQLAEMLPDGIVFIFGMARLSYIRKICSEKPEQTVIIYEPSAEIFSGMMESADLTFLKENHFLFVKDLFDDAWCICLNYLLSVDVAGISRYLCAPNYDRIFSEIYSEYRKNLYEYAEVSMIDRNTMMRFGEEIPRNSRNNLMYVARSHDLKWFVDNFPKGKPAIIVSAGPSLNKNIEELKNAVGKAFIVATDTALKPLINHGIMPDIFTTVDPSKPLLLFDREEVRKIPMVICEDGNSEVVERHEGKQFFTTRPNGFCTYYYQKYEKEEMLLESGGSVANNAFSLARECGCNPIILIGQDLAYTGNKSHADGTFQDKMEEKKLEGSAYLDVEDIYGNTIRTSKDFDYYRKWFEKQIAAHTETKVIDATEGGAKIEGAVLMTLKEAIGQYCQTEFLTEELLEKVPEIFSEEEREEIDEYLLSTPEILEKLKKKAKEVISEYEEMEFYAKRNELGKQFQKGMKKVRKLVDYLEEDQTMKLIRPLIVEKEHLTRRSILNNQAESTDDVLELMKSGTQNMKDTIEAIDKLKDGFDEMVEKLKKLRER